MNSASTKGLISKLYARLGDRIKSRAGWERDVGTITKEQWDKILEQGALVSISPSQRVSHLFLIHRVYNTPQKNV